MGARPLRRLTALLLAAAAMPVSCGSGQPFDSMEWKSRTSAGETGYVLAEMTQSLLDDGTLIGMSRTEVIALLGEWQLRSGAGSDLEWVIDEHPGFMSATVLEVRFGPSGLVSEAMVWTRGE